ncbi:MAG: hypothetical protein V2A34_07555, partial [Lentisphaerota bacterium]
MSYTESSIGGGGFLKTIRYSVLSGLLAVSGMVCSVQAGWIIPTSNNNPSRWSNETLARDTNTTTYATYTPNRTGWGQAIELYITNSIKCRRIQVYSDYQTGVDAVRLEVRRYPSLTWLNVYEGAVDNQAWTIINFGATNINACRFTYRFTDTYAFWLYELKMFEEPPVISLPSCESLDASSVEENTVILHGNLTDDGGDLCQWRMQYGLTSLYSTNSDWVGNEVAVTHFSKLLLNLESNTLYHFRAQVKNGAGIASGADGTFETGPPMTGWISPSGSLDPSNAWTFEDSAYDDNTNTVAKCYHDMGAPVWSPYLFLTHSVMLSDRIMFYGRDTAEIDQAEVGVYRNGLWTNVYASAFTNLQWTEAGFPEGTVTQARIRFRLTSTGYGLDYELNEFKFHRIFRVIISGHYNQSKPVTLAINGVTNGTFTNFSTNVYSFGVAVGAGSSILVYYNDDNLATNGGALATLATGYNMTDLDLENQTLILRSDGANAIDNEALITGYSGDPDIPYRFSGQNIIVTNNITLKVLSGHTYAPGTNTLRLYGDLITDGAMDPGAGSVVFAGRSAISGATTPSLNDVTITGVMSAPTNRMTVSGNWVNSGIFSNRNGTIDFSGNTLISGATSSSFYQVDISGALTAPAGTMRVAGDWNNNGVFSNAHGAVTFNGKSVVGGSSDTYFYNVALAAGSSLKAPPGNLYVDGSWDNLAGGIFSNNSGTVVFGGTSVATNRGNTTFYNYTCTTPGKQLYYAAGSTQVIQGILHLTGESGSQVVLRSVTAGSKWSFSVPGGAQDVTYVDVRDSNATNNTITVSGGTDSGNNNPNWIFAQTRYWVGGSGNWSQTAHWAVTNGGAGGATVPGLSNLVFFTWRSGSGQCTADVPAVAKGFTIETGTVVAITLKTNSLTVSTGGFDQ